MFQPRSEPRFLCSELAQVRVSRGRSTRWTTVANLEDISPSGACLQLEQAIREGEAVDIVCRKCRLRGIVKYCRWNATGYQAGIRFHHSKSWNLNRFEPSYFLPLAIRGGRR